MTVLKRTAALFAALILLFSLCGCTVFAPVDKLYSLPQASEGYIQLQQLVDRELDGGCEYSAPAGGAYRQSIQLVDLDGDGFQEALAFFRTPEQALRVCVYTAASGKFSLAASISGEGVAIGGVDYADMDGDGRLELLIAWQVSSAQKMLSVYSLKSWECPLLLTADCAEFHLSDIDSDSLAELFTLRPDGSGSCSVEMYSLSPDGEMLVSASRLSAGVTELRRIRTGRLSDGSAGLFVESRTESGSLVTDIFASGGGSLENLSLRPDGSSSAERDYEVYCCDVDGDGTMDVPFVVPLRPQSENSAPFRALDWYDYSAYGGKAFRFSTYHCYADGWYIVLPDTLKSSELGVRRHDSVYGERAVVISRFEGGTVTDMFTVYTLTGENRHDRAGIGGRFVLYQDSTTVYAARISPDGVYSEDEIKEMFNIIYSEWKTGAL